MESGYIFAALDDRSRSSDHFDAVLRYRCRDDDQPG
jgi:hypothetical protein